MASKATKQVSYSNASDESKSSHRKSSVLTNLRNCDDQIASLEALIENNLKEETSVLQKKKRLEESRDKLCEQQPRLQERLQQVIQAITQSESECFSLKKKLPYLSRRAIVDNIGHLELQLRLHNYRPREEELMLREITKLRNSLPVLEEYRTSVQLNRQHRSDRVKLVSQRNDCYDRLQALLPKIQACSEQLSNVQQILQENRKGLEEVKRHKAQLLEVAKKQLEKKRRRQLELEKFKEEGQTSLELDVPVTPRRVVPVERDVYGPQLAACRMLLQYCHSVGPVLCDDITVNTASAHDTSEKNTKRNFDASSTGTFYSKPKDSLGPDSALLHQRSPYKKKKARNRAKKDLKHPPDVIGHFLDLGIEVPKNAGDIPAVVIDIQQKLNYFEMLNEQVYFDTVEKIRRQDATADIIHVVFQPENPPEKNRAFNRSCSSVPVKNFASLGATASSSGFTCHRTQNIFESDASVDVMVGSSPPKLYSDIAKTALTPIAEKSIPSPNIEINRKQNGLLNESQSTTPSAATQVICERPTPFEGVEHSSGKATTSVEKVPCEPTSKDSLPISTGSEFIKGSDHENDTRVSSVAEEKSIAEELNNVSENYSSHTDGIQLDDHASAAAERSSCDNEDCESGVYEEDFAQKLGFLQITTSVPKAHESETLSSSAVESNEMNSQDVDRENPEIIVECVKDNNVVVPVVMDPTCSSDSSSSSGCSCTSNASSRQGVEVLGQEETQSLCIGKPTLQSSSSPVVSCNDLAPESGFTETVEPCRIDIENNISSSSNSLLLPLPSTTQDNSNITQCSGSALDKPCGVPAYRLDNGIQNENNDEVNNNRQLSTISGFCALSPSQEAALAFSEAATVMSYASVAKKKS